MIRESEENRFIREQCRKYLLTGGRSKLPYSRLIYWECSSCGTVGAVETNEVSLCGLVRAARAVMICCGVPDVCRVETISEKQIRERRER